MPGTATAPDVTTTPTGVSISFHLVDASGDTTTEDMPVANTAALGDIQGLAETYQAASNASLWKVSRTQSWEGAIDPDNAVAEFRAGVNQGVNLLFRNTTTFVARSWRLVAPIASTMQGNQDIPLVTATAFANMITDYLTLASGFDLETAQYTDRRERKNNPKIRV